MTLMLRVIECDGIEMRMIGDPPVETPFDLTVSGRWRAVVEYFDDATPNVITHTHEFVFATDRVDVAQALVEAQTLGKKMRDTRALIASLQTVIGTPLPLE